jgi:hypothetical protein
MELSMNHRLLWLEEALERQLTAWENWYKPEMHDVEDVDATVERQPGLIHVKL